MFCKNCEITYTHLWVPTNHNFSQKKMIPFIKLNGMVHTVSAIKIHYTNSVCPDWTSASVESCPKSTILLVSHFWCVFLSNLVQRQVGQHQQMRSKQRNKKQLDSAFEQMLCHFVLFVYPIWGVCVCERHCACVCVCPNTTIEQAQYH